MDARAAEPGLADTRPILLVPYMWIGDFVRCHSVVRVLKQRWPHRPVDMLATPLTAPLTDYMPGVRKHIIGDIPRKRLGILQQIALVRRLRDEQYGTALIMSRKWKAALAPFLAGIPERVGFVGEARFGLLNDLRWGERKLPRMIDQCAALALPRDCAPPSQWPPPRLEVPPAQVIGWKTRRNIPPSGERLIVLAPGAVGPSKRWPAERYGQVARQLTRQGFLVGVVGGPAESDLAQQIIQIGGERVRNFTGTDLREGILALAAADAVVSNDSGLMHVAAALGTPTIGIFGPTSAWHWAPLNPLAATIEAQSEIACRPCHKPTCRFAHHQCMGDISGEQVLNALTRVLSAVPAAVV